MRFPLDDKGFTLAEVIVAMALNLIMLGVVCSLFTTSAKTNATSASYVGIQQCMRTAMQGVVGDLRRVGYNPTANGLVKILAISPTSLSYNYDQLGNGTIQTVAFAVSADGNLTKSTGVSTRILLSGVNGIAFTYYDRNRAATVDPASVATIQISLTAQSAIRDRTYAQNGGYRFFSISEKVSPPNLWL